MTTMERLQELTDFLNFVKGDKGLAKNTSDAYQSDLKIFMEFLSKQDLNWSSVTHGAITDFLWEEKKKGKSPATLARYIESIRQIFRFLITENRITEDPTAA